MTKGLKKNVHMQQETPPRPAAALRGVTGRAVGRGPGAALVQVQQAVQRGVRHKPDQATRTPVMELIGALETGRSDLAAPCGLRLTQSDSKHSLCFGCWVCAMACGMPHASSLLKPFTDDNACSTQTQGRHNVWWTTACVS